MNDAKRRDNKGRLLRTGESQREDGRYMYRYKDPYGKVKNGIQLAINQYGFDTCWKAQRSSFKRYDSGD